MKYLGVEHGVNVTLGLPFVRTSPDHGTAFDIAGRGSADPRSFAAAVRMARTLAGDAIVGGVAVGGAGGGDISAAGVGAASVSGASASAVGSRCATLPAAAKPGHPPAPTSPISAPQCTIRGKPGPRASSSRRTPARRSTAQPSSTATAQPFDDPSESPATNCFCNSTNTISVGIAAIKAAAEIMFWLVTN